eukprot:SAG22_NODE_277_length_13166_cov_134.125277_5_plen_279_part_00
MVATREDQQVASCSRTRRPAAAICVSKKARQIGAAVRTRRAIGATAAQAARGDAGRDCAAGQRARPAGAGGGPGRARGQARARAASLPHRSAAAAAWRLDGVLLLDDRLRLLGDGRLLRGSGLLVAAELLGELGCTPDGAAGRAREHAEQVDQSTPRSKPRWQRGRRAVGRPRPSTRRSRRRRRRPARRRSRRRPRRGRSSATCAPPPCISMSDLYAAVVKILLAGGADKSKKTRTWREMLLLTMGGVSTTKWATRWFSRIALKLFHQHSRAPPLVST